MVRRYEIKCYRREIWSASKKHGKEVDKAIQKLKAELDTIGVAGLIKTNKLFLVIKSDFSEFYIIDAELRQDDTYERIRERLLRRIKSLLRSL